ncbi:MAG TPA: FUN14 domain-containing protein [Candidatus Babeliales bacterium]|nr:FUN14 domain-containing protein [Candidatus Babeliales bacterium]
MEYNGIDMELAQGVMPDFGIADSVDVINIEVANNPVEPGFLNKVLDVLSPSKLMQKMNLSKEMLMQMGVAVAVGFLIGFLLKKYSKVVFVLVLLGFILFLLQHGGIFSITVHWAKIRELLNIQPIALSNETVLADYWDWVKHHLGLVVSFSVGCVAGLRLA